ncbi:hypothetical protein os4_38110 (plasmid) [Comamonadaceae bacterium OS-4]|jgi:hypothetical protein|nr:hypothetical protein os4_38110 [Comamonadaceae bacterium OS-4]
MTRDSISSQRKTILVTTLGLHRRKQGSQMQPKEWDARVVRAGHADPALSACLAQSGQRVVPIERHRLGGTCVNTGGCTRSKTLIASGGVLVASAACPLCAIDREHVGAHAPWLARNAVQTQYAFFLRFPHVLIATGSALNVFAAEA